MYQVMIPISGAIAGLGIVFLISLLLSPYKQRDEARKHIAELQREITDKPKTISVKLVEPMKLHPRRYNKD